MNRNLFKNANLKEIGQLRRYMSIIYDNADFYSKHFVNKTIIYTTKNKKIELTARRDNFMHLCGVTYIDGPRKFFNDALDQKIQIKKNTYKKRWVYLSKITNYESISRNAWTTFKINRTQ